MSGGLGSLEVGLLTQFFPVASDITVPLQRIVNLTRISYFFCRLNSTLGEGGSCGCLDGWVAWKWDCHPAGHLGDPCVTSLQCQVKVSKYISLLSGIAREHT